MKRRGYTKTVDVGPDGRFIIPVTREMVADAGVKWDIQAEVKHGKRPRVKLTARPASKGKQK